MIINKSIIFVIALSCSLMGRAAHADFLADLSVQTSQTVGGDTLYTYTLTVYPDSTLPADGLVINVDTDSNIYNIGSLPTGWDTLYNPGEPSIGWAADQFSPYLSPGTTTIFSFASPLPPATQDYTLFGLDDSGQIDGMITGKILAPSAAAVPEPTSMIPMGIGLATVAGYGVYRRSKEPSPPSD